MTWFERHVALVQFPERAEEAPCHSFVESEPGRKLYQHGSEFCSKTSGSVEELLKCRARVHKHFDVGHCLGDFDGEAEVIWGGRSPTFPSCAAMRTMEAGVDLGAAQSGCVSIKMRSLRTLM